MMKAIGMRNNVVKSVVRIQALVSIFIAVLLGTIVTIGSIEEELMRKVLPLQKLLEQ